MCRNLRADVLGGIGTGTNVAPFMPVDLIRTRHIGRVHEYGQEYRGCNFEAARCRTKGPRFRDRKRNLMRRNSNKYCLLSYVDMYDAIDLDWPASWVPGS